MTFFKGRFPAGGCFTGLFRATSGVMIKIPVGQTIRFAYAFTIRHIGIIIGLVWVGMVLDAVVKYFAMSRYYSGMATALESGSADLSAFLPLLAYVVGGTFF